MDGTAVVADTPGTALGSPINCDQRMPGTGAEASNPSCYRVAVWGEFGVWWGCIMKEMENTNISMKRKIAALR